MCLVSIHFELGITLGSDFFFFHSTIRVLRPLLSFYPYKNKRTELDKVYSFVNEGHVQYMDGGTRF